MSPPRNSLADLMAPTSYPTVKDETISDIYALLAKYGLLQSKEPPRNALAAYRPQPSHYGNALWGWQPKTEWVEGHWRTEPDGLFGYKRVWVAGYWRREGF